MFLPKWCAHCVVVSGQTKKGVPVANNLQTKSNTQLLLQNQRHNSSHLFFRSKYRGIETITPSSSSVSVNNSSTQEFIYYNDSVQIKQDNKKRSSLMGSTNFSNKDAYELKSWLGSGGFGRVYSAVRVADNMPVAIKYVNRWKVVDWELVNGVKVPLEYALQLSVASLPGVVRALDCYEVGKDHVAIVTELLEPSRDLYDVLVQEGPLPIPLARHYFRQIVRAVVGCYRLGVLHRDIKAENVVIHLKTHQVKLIDFGCGAYDDQEINDRLIGTRDYYAPEMLAASGPRYRAEEVAVWSLGVLLFAMVCGELPFKSKRHLLEAYFEFPNRSTADWGCADLINQLLQRIPKHRRRLEDILRHPWFAIVDDLKPVQQKRRPKSPDSRHI